MLRQKISLKYQHQKVAYLFLLPFFLSFLIFFAFPAIYSLVLSFYKYRGYGAAKFIGFRNYVALLQYQLFWRTLSNTFFYYFMHAVPVTVIAFTLALLMYSKTVGRLNTVYKPLIFLPRIVAIVAASLIWKVILATRYGVINSFFGTRIAFLEDLSIMRWSVVMVIIWRATSWFFVVYLAGLTTISQELYDAATIDGATSPQRLWYITLPLMKPIFMFAFIMDLIMSLRMFTEPYVLMSSGQITPPEIGTVMFLLLNNTRGGNFGKASAVGWVLFVIIFVISSIQYLFFRNKEE